MTLIRKSLAWLLLIAPCTAALAQDSDAVTVPLSDPTHPGVVHVGIVTGSIVIRGRDIRDVIVRASGGIEGRPPPVPEDARGLRRLIPQPSISIEEQNNRVQISSQTVNRPMLLDIQVPRRTQLELSTVNDGNIRIEGVEGELDVGNVNGSIELSDVGGAVVAHTVNGRVQATFTHVASDKPMAFTSLNGVVDVTLPSTVKANLKLRTDNGSVYTDFDLNMLPAPEAARPSPDDKAQGRGRYHLDVNKVIYGSVNGGGPDIEMRTFNGNIYLRKGGGASGNTAATPAKR